MMARAGISTGGHDIDSPAVPSFHPAGPAAAPASAIRISLALNPAWLTTEATMLRRTRNMAPQSAPSSAVTTDASHPWT